MISTNEENALRLAAAILEQAKFDCINAILSNDEQRVISLERFFMGNWGQELSLCQGDIIVAWCRRIAAGVKTCRVYKRSHKRDAMKQNE